MRKYLYWLLISASLVAGCNGNTSDEPELEISENRFENITADGEKLSVDVTSNTRWQIVDAPEWIFVSPREGKGNGRIVIDVQANESYTERHGKFSITNLDITRTIELTQAGQVFVEQIDVTPSEIADIDASGIATELNITSNVKWSITGAPDWVKLNPTKGEGDAKILVSVDKNSDKSSGRECTLTLKGVDLSREIHLSQKRYELFKTVLIKAGKFLMGSPDGTGGINGDKAEEGRPDYYETLHEVTISKDYLMTAYPITNSQFAEFLNDVGVEEDYVLPDSYESEFAGRRIFQPNTWSVVYKNGKWTPSVVELTGGGTRDYSNYPVTGVNWYGATVFAKWAGGALPTEAQWEYACRAGSQTAYYFGDDASMLGDYAWFEDNSANSTQPVGKKKPNAWGLYDMIGNVCEWCCEDFRWDYAELEPVDPKNEVTPWEKKAIRGGYHKSQATECRCASRSTGALPTMATEYTGFRIVFEQE